MNWDFIFSQTLSQALGPGVVVFALAAIGLNVQFGYTGLLNFGQAAFAGIGAYGLAIGMATLDWPFWPSILLGLIGAVLLALLLGVATLRLRADYLAIATVAAAEALRRVVRTVELREWTGGAEGLRGFTGDFREFGRDLGITENLRIGPFFFTASDLWVMIVGWSLVAVCLLVVWLAMRSPWGRVLKAIREDEDAVRSLGKNAFSYKLQSLMLGGVIGALAGFIQALRFGNVAPDQYHTTFTFYVYAVLILGGAARVFGPVVGAMIFWGLYNFLNQFLRGVAGSEWMPSGLLTTSQVDPLVFVLLGAGIIALLIFRPQGIFGDRREISLNVR
ncbi:branched-chain amino acid ABC transporter permease [Natronosporangium hydrolyticum]|uniref:Branched-chain amino acid ABC transporter permease n=1 Tax=Natronosporangium hydrolyticum TaxID=2811111 RepID=A0A895YBZ4_9ACTN|nr:branched-chain amino acid ABC transporter permease [Natronosporangium hydrolyticum]QSB12963.1 branched-chain amino acid ABC transporter permease [Natronosporangium hydrolyticum]